MINSRHVLSPRRNFADFNAIRNPGLTSRDFGHRFQFANRVSKICMRSKSLDVSICLHRDSNRPHVRVRIRHEIFQTGRFCVELAHRASYCSKRAIGMSAGVTEARMMLEKCEGRARDNACGLALVKITLSFK